jgi:argininosuccinate lyase
MTLWSGRFSEGPDRALWDFTVDHADRRLLAYDVLGSQAHVAMLGEVGILDAGEAGAIRDGLQRIADEASLGEFAFLDTDEDVHTAVERRLGELIGPAAGKLHTGRSRNDQVCLDLRLYLRDAVDRRVGQIEDMVRAVLTKAAQAGNAVVPSYTHMQQAQAIPLAHHLLAYGWMLIRDVERFRRARERIAVSPLGAGASAGSSLPIDPSISARALGFDVVFANSLDAVGSRDFVAEYAFCCAQAMANLSRLAEELVLWSTSEFGWVSFADRHTTGSSALPHKKNADIAELTRGKAASSAGDVVTLLALQKGLPLAYNRDLQEDKAAVFHADDALAGAMTAMRALLSSAEFHAPPPGSWVLALDLAELLVSRGVAFRSAHESVGSLVARLVAQSRDLTDVTPDELALAHEAFQPADVAVLDAGASVRRRRSGGGGSFESVAKQLAALSALVPGPGLTA